MEFSSLHTHRFDRLRRVILLRETKVKRMEEQVIHYFEDGNLGQIEKLMKEKNAILSANSKMLVFIEKWERREKDEQYYAAF